MTASACALDYAEPSCQSFGGEPLERLVGELVVEMLTPAGLEVSHRAAEECQRQRAALDHQWQLRLERARQDAARAFRQYNAVEPENRLVARTLEQRWEEALLAQRALEEEYDRFRREQPVRLSAAEHAAIATLAQSASGVAIAHDIGGGQAAGRAAAVAAGGGLAVGIERSSWCACTGAAAR